MDISHPQTGEHLHAAAMNALDWIVMALLIIGGLNWGAVGLAQFDLVASLFGAGSTAARSIYVLVGLAGLYTIYLCIRKMPRVRH